MFKYFLFFISMLVGAGLGIFLGLNAVTNRDVRKSVPEEDDNAAHPNPKHVEDKTLQPIEPSGENKGDKANNNQVPANCEGLIKSKLGEYVSIEADPDEADEILEKMHKQHQLYCTLKEN